MAQDSIPRDALMGNFQTRYTWRKVERPKPWRPKIVGEVLLGFYGGKSVRTGMYGEYTTVIVHVPGLPPAAGSFTLSGIQVVQAFDVADLKIGWPVRVVWTGLEDLGEIVEETEVAGVKSKKTKKKQMKRFDVFVAEGDPVSADELPKVTDVAASSAGSQQ